jgi:plastocyanin
MSWFRKSTATAHPGQGMQAGRRFGSVTGLLALLALLMAACAPAPTPAAPLALTAAPVLEAMATPTDTPVPAVDTDTPPPAVETDTPVPAVRTDTPVPTVDTDSPTPDGRTDTQVPDTRIVPSVSVADQKIADGQVIIAEVVSDGPGWLVIHAQADGKPGPILGYSPVANGTNSNVPVHLDLSAATTTLFAMLHIDAGTVGAWEFPGGPDTPVLVNGQMVSPAFKLQVVTGEAEVEMEDFQFRPKVLVIGAGTTVKWANKDEVQHTATSDTGLWDSGYLAKGDKFSLTFSEPGTYPYYCIPHGGPSGKGMAATIIVLK